MAKLKTIGAIAALAVMAGTMVSADAAGVRGATKVSAVKKMGAQQIAGTSIQKIVSGRTLDHEGWTWTFKPDGTQSSKAKDGSWKTTGTWRIDGNQICRTNSETQKEKCSDVYVLGRDLKFTEGNKRTLANWYAAY